LTLSIFDFSLLPPPSPRLPHRHDAAEDGYAIFARHHAQPPFRHCCASAITACPSPPVSARHYRTFATPHFAESEKKR